MIKKNCLFAMSGLCAIVLSSCGGGAKFKSIETIKEENPSIEFHEENLSTYESQLAFDMLCYASDEDNVEITSFKRFGEINQSGYFTTYSEYYTFETNGDAKTMFNLLKESFDEEDGNYLAYSQNNLCYMDQAFYDAYII